jgi:hypothetical protein
LDDSASMNAACIDLQVQERAVGSPQKIFLLRL